MRVLVLAGGDSSERDVSLRSGGAVCRALNELGHHVQALDPKDGRSLIGPDGTYLLQAPVEEETNDLPDFAQAPGLMKAMNTGEFGEVDVVLLALHGGAGENGTIQCLLDLAGMPYTGSGMAASAVAMDKAMTKRLMASVDVPTPKWGLVRLGADDDLTEVAAEIHHQFKLPMIVKPNDGGSTIGLTKVKAAGEIEPALKLAAKYGTGVLVEEFIAGREITVTVFDGQSYPLVEIRPTNELYDYEAKYTKGKSQYIAPAEVDPSIAGQMQEAAVRLYEAVGASGLARIDFILTETGAFYCLELNTLPGMTELSLAPMAMKCKDISYERLIQMMLESALRKQE